MHREYPTPAGEHYLSHEILAASIAALSTPIFPKDQRKRKKVTAKKKKKKTKTKSKKKGNVLYHSVFEHNAKNIYIYDSSYTQQDRVHRRRPQVKNITNMKQTIGRIGVCNVAMHWDLFNRQERQGQRQR
jgi:hypothetical protein